MNAIKLILVIHLLGGMLAGARGGEVQAPLSIDEVESVLSRESDYSPVDMVTILKDIIKRIGELRIAAGKGDANGMREFSRITGLPLLARLMAKGEETLREFSEDSTLGGKERTEMLRHLRVVVQQASIYANLRRLSDLYSGPALQEKLKEYRASFVMLDAPASPGDIAAIRAFLARLVRDHGEDGLRQADGARLPRKDIARILARPILAEAAASDAWQTGDGRFVYISRPFGFSNPDYRVVIGHEAATYWVEVEGPSLANPAATPDPQVGQQSIPSRSELQPASPATGATIAWLGLAGTQSAALRVLAVCGAQLEVERLDPEGSGSYLISPGFLQFPPWVRPELIATVTQDFLGRQPRVILVWPRSTDGNLLGDSMPIVNVVNGSGVVQTASLQEHLVAQGLAIMAPAMRAIDASVPVRARLGALEKLAETMQRGEWKQRHKEMTALIGTAQQ